MTGCPMVENSRPDFRPSAVGPTWANRGDSESLHKYSGLRRVREDVPWRLLAVAVIGFWERAAFWGLTAPWRKLLLQPFTSNNVAD
jgi:hypothetical protein